MKTKLFILFRYFVVPSLLIVTIIISAFGDWNQVLQLLNEMLIDPFPEPAIAYLDLHMFLIALLISIWLEPRIVKQPVSLAKEILDAVATDYDDVVATDLDDETTFSDQGTYAHTSEVNAFCGTRTPATILVLENRNGSFWYCVKGSPLANLTYQPIEEGINVESHPDCDTYYFDRPINTTEELVKAIEQ